MSVQSASKATATVTAATTSTVSGSGIQAWIGYHVAIVSGTGAGQMRYAPTSPGTNQLNIVPDWDVTPDVTSVIHQAKNQADYNTDYGNKWKLLLKATEEWDGGDFFDVGNGANNVVFGMTGQGISLDAYFRIYSGSYFSLGSLFNNTSLGGWYFDSNNSNATLGYIFLTVDSGAYARIQNTNLGTVYAHRFDFKAGSNVWIYDASFNNLMYSGSNLLGTTKGRNLKLQGKGVANDFVNINTGINGFEGPFVMSNSYGLKPSGTSQTIIMNKYISAIPVRDMEALGSNIFEFRSPVFGAATGNPIVLWTDNAGTSGWDEKFKLSVSAKAGATALLNARFVIVEGTTVKTLVNRGNTDASGLFTDYILKRRARTSATITTYLPNLATCYKYDYLPFSATIDPTADVVLPIPFSVDTTLAVNEATALAYTGITFTKAITNSNTAIAFDAYTGIFAVNDVVTQTPSGASGTVKELVDNGDGTGYIFMISRNGTAFVDNQALQVSAVTQATSDTTTFSENFTWAVEANALSMQSVNDYHMAKLAMNTPVDAWVAELQERFGRVIDKSGTEFFTNNTSSEGAWVYNRGAGTVQVFTSDSGVTWTPPSTTNVTFDKMRENTEVRVFLTNTQTELAGIEDASTGTFDNRSYTWSAAAGTIVDYQLISKQYKIIRVEGYTVPATDTTIAIQQAYDLNY